MVASLASNSNASLPLGQVVAKDSEAQNRVLLVLMRRLGASKTFGENMIFMLNRAGMSITSQFLLRINRLII